MNKLERFRRAAGMEPQHGTPDRDNPPCQHADWKMERPCCGDRWMCENAEADTHGVPVTGNYCRTRCNNRTLWDPELPTLSLILTAFNEDPQQIRDTVASARQAYPLDKLHIILVDDGSSTPAVEALEDPDQVHVVRHDTPQGVGRARNAGWAVSAGQVPVFCDAHMEYPREKEMRSAVKERFQEALEAEIRAPEESVLTIAARKAMETGWIVSPATRHRRRGEAFWACGADLYWNRRESLQVKWRRYPDEEDAWPRVPAMLGACYVMRRQEAKRLEEATGQLWDDIAGRWGFSEQALSLKAYLMGTEVHGGRDVFTRHQYNREIVGSGKVQTGKDVWRNGAYAMGRILSPETFKRRVEPHAKKRLADEWEEIYDPMDERPWSRADETRFFIRCCGKGAPVTEAHSQHEWLPEVARAADEVDQGLDRPLKVIQWRPGEATLMLRTMYPDAEIRCVVMRGARANSWWDVCQANDITIQKAPVDGDYVERPAKKGWEADLVLVGGERQAECAKAAKRLLSNIGKIVVHENADRTLIEPDELKKERQKLEDKLPDIQSKTDSQTVASGALPSNSAHQLPEVTVLLLNWKRPENWPRILESVAAQTVPTRVVMWDNSGRRHDPINKASQYIDEIIFGEVNRGCVPRWWLASQAETEYVVTIDDDLALADDTVLEDAIAAQREECPDGIVGFWGWSHVDGKSYKDGAHVGAGRPGDNENVDVVKGRFTVMPTRLLSRVPMRAPAEVCEAAGMSAREVQWTRDDIYVSMMISQGQPGYHRVPERLKKRWENINVHDGNGACQQAGHWEARTKVAEALRNYFSVGVEA